LPDGEDDEEMDEDDDLSDEALIEGGRDPGLDSAPAVLLSVVTSVTLSHLIVTLSLPLRLAALSSLNTLSFPPAGPVPSPHPPTTSVLSVLHLRALETLNNLLLTIAASDPGSKAQSIPVARVWDIMFTSIDALLTEPTALSMKGQELRMEVLEMSLGVAWGCAKISSDSLVSAVRAQPRLNLTEQGLTDARVKTIMDVPQVLRADIAKSRCIDILASLASRQNVTVDENRVSRPARFRFTRLIRQVIGGFLVSQLSSAPNAEILVALLDAIIEIHSDETRAYDSVFVSEGYLNILSGQVAKVKAEIKKIDKRKDARLRALAEDVYENLTAFIKYRRALRR
jgi:hypothetical protein